MNKKNLFKVLGMVMKSGKENRAPISNNGTKAANKKREHSVKNDRTVIIPAKKSFLQTCTTENGGTRMIHLHI